MTFAGRSFVKITAMTCFLMGSAIGAVQAQSSDVQSLLDRINRLEADLTNVQRKVYQGQNVPAPSSLSGSQGAGISEGSGAAAVLSSRLDTLEQEQRRLTGTFEEMNFKIEQIKTRLDKLVLDIDYRLTEIETRMNGGGQAVTGAAPLAQADSNAAATASSSTLPAPTQSSDSTLPKGSQVLGTLRVDQQGNSVGATTAAPTQQAAAVASSSNPADQYNDAISMIRRDDYAGAEVAFAKFIAENPQHDLAGHAQYWLGESFYVRENYPSAATAFLKGYQEYPNSSKAADNLLKLAMTLGRMDQKVEACATFGQLEKQFSNLPSRLKRIAEREKDKFECQ